MIYNETNFTQLFQNSYIEFNSTQEAGLTLVNGSGVWQAGYVSSYCRVEGFDLLMQLLIVITVFLAFIVMLLSLYVGLYVWRYLNYD